jgi:dGTPase
MREKWKKLLSEKRLLPPSESVKKQKSDETLNGRSEFQKDLDRIVFSGSFRRLGRKSQAHPLNENDHIHTRLSHSLEVASVGRSLGNLVGRWLKEEKSHLPENVDPSDVGDIVKAACLAHDIGNPPFGHAGENAIKEWYRYYFEEKKEDDAFKQTFGEGGCQKDFQYFDGNAMAFRVLTNNEYYKDKYGMRLTHATLGTLLKYPWTSHFAEENKEKFSCFQTEVGKLKELSEGLGLSCKTEKSDTPGEKIKCDKHPLAYLVEAADDICNGILDLEDAAELNIMSNYITTNFRAIIEKDLTQDEKNILDDENVNYRMKNGLIRGKSINILIEDAFGAFIDNYDAIMKGNFNNSLIEPNTKPNFNILAKAKNEKEKNVYSFKRKAKLELGAFYSLGNLLKTLHCAYDCVIDPGHSKSHKAERVMTLLKFKPSDIDKKYPPSGYYFSMAILDYLTGMTDQYATLYNRRISGYGL